MRITDIESLSPDQRLELADALYDSTMQEIEAAEPFFTDEQRNELDRRLARLHSGQAVLVSGPEAYARLSHGR